jgi:probable rRNA maturation factor
MTDRVELVDGTGSLSSHRALVELAGAVLSEEGSEGSFSLALVGEAVMTDLNRRYRGEEGPTDVLSFSEHADGEADTWPGAPYDDPAPSGVPVGIALGEVIICPAVVRRYAAEEGVSPGYQLGWTAIHGTLHLLGYDHEHDRGEMRAREEELLSRLAGLLGDLDLLDVVPADEP